MEDVMDDTNVYHIVKPIILVTEFYLLTIF
jgi:hypothetical protein